MWIGDSDGQKFRDTPAKAGQFFLKFCVSDEYSNIKSSKIRTAYFKPTIERKANPKGIARASQKFAVRKTFKNNPRLSSIARWLYKRAKGLVQPFLIKIKLTLFFIIFTMIIKIWTNLLIIK